MEFLNVLSRTEMKNITGGGHCEFYCCDSGGCGEALGGWLTFAEPGNTNETCQTAGLGAGVDGDCGPGQYLGALYFSGPPH